MAYLNVKQMPTGQTTYILPILHFWNRKEDTISYYVKSKTCFFRETTSVVLTTQTYRALVSLLFVLFPICSGLLSGYLLELMRERVAFDASFRSTTMALLASALVVVTSNHRVVLSSML